MNLKLPARNSFQRAGRSRFGRSHRRWLAGACRLRREVKLPAIFGRHMVVQRDRPMTIGGWAAPGRRFRPGAAGEAGDSGQRLGRMESDAAAGRKAAGRSRSW